MSGNELVVDTNIFINLGTENLGIDKFYKTREFIYLLFQKLKS